MTKDFNYGLGVINAGPWITQTLGFAGASGAVGYLPEQKLTIAVETTNGPGAYDDKGQRGTRRGRRVPRAGRRSRTQHNAQAHSLTCIRSITEFATGLSGGNR